jgi:PKD repeat protein
VEPLSVAFTGNIRDADGSIASILWSFGDGSTSNVANPTHVFQCDGTYKVTLEVVDDRGGVGSATVPVTVSSAGGPINYACDVQPVFNRTCTGCHGGSARLSLTTCENLQIGSFRGPVVTPGTKETSRLWLRLNSTTSPMPPIGGLLPQSERDAVGAWIDSLDPLDANYCD